MNTLSFPLHNGNVFPNLQPGWTDYKKTIHYHTFDVKYELAANNTIGFMVGTGWHSGYVGSKHYNLYGTDEELLFELHVQFNDGTSKIVKSDDTWQVATGELIYSDLLHGEVFYENRQRYGWMNYNFSTTRWSAVVTNPIHNNVQLAPGAANLISTPGPLVSVNKIWKVANQTWVYEFDNMVTGQIQLKISDFPYSARVQVRYAEAIHPNRTLYTGSHGEALVTDTFVLNGKCHYQVP